MPTGTYQQLAKFLDELPGGFPATDSGVELKILEKLFLPEEAELLMHLSLIPEPASVIAYRANLAADRVAEMLAAMEKKGLLYAQHKDGKAPQYMAMQFVVGIYEFQLNKMYPEIAELFEEYLPYIIEMETWQKAPQIRTIPVGESIDAEAVVMDYERAEELVLNQERISVADCICRQEKEILGEPCVKPTETCLSFGSGADFYVRNEMGRYITTDEALEILNIAEETGLVLQPDAAQDATFICCCCGCCCGVLTNLKRHPSPANYAVSAFVASHDEDLCDGCGLCQERCQMDALYLDDGIMQVDRDYCIGCGLCVPTCPNEALSMERKQGFDSDYLPKTAMDKFIHLGKTRGVLDNRKMAKMFIKSKKDRLMADQGGRD